ncbi:MAG: glucokinase [Sphingomonadales bacterium 32-68-7]|nr:MAG: glucokinase [Sphingomonadales bacterium 12-68-11]OYX09480.1 MAG: glucokinase [Sphingomonadales bacterium 32-68-7]
MSAELVAIDVGGTHARFARATIGDDGTIALAEPVTLATQEYSGLEAAWAAYTQRAGGAVPRAAAIAIAGPVTGDSVPMTNSRWVLRVAAFKAAAGLEAVTVLNDFGAVAHAVARAPADMLTHVAGPEGPLPDHGTVSVLGPGTGIGIAYFHRDSGGCRVQATEGGHIGFAPQDAFEDRLLADLRERHGRVPTEGINAGPGIVWIYRALGGDAAADDRTVWERGLAGEDALAGQAIDRFCASLGSLAGDYALVHGSSAVVLAGSLSLQLRDRLRAGEFHSRFCAKPRYEAMMAGISVKLITHPQPGLYGAAAAFQSEHMA